MSRSARKKTPPSLRTPVAQDKKTWHIKDLLKVQPLNEKQTDVFSHYEDGDHIALIGSAGTGKTYLATYLAMRDLMNNDVDKVMFFRSTVQSRNMGFLPGELEEKYAPFEQPYKDTLAQLFNRTSTYDEMKKRGMVEFHPTAFLRGITCDNAVMIIDEAQNMTFQEIDTILTRVGENSRVYIVGDTRQDDLKNNREVSGLSSFLKVINNSDLFSTVEFKAEDCVRSGFVKDWLQLKEAKGQ